MRGIERHITSDDAAQAIYDVIDKRLRPKPTFIGSSDTDDDDSGGFDSPMTDVGDIIVGGTAGAPTRRGIGAEGEVATVVSGTVQWQAVGAVSVAARYRSAMYTTQGGGSMLFDSDGHLMYTLESLE